mmetsp:Transcript_31100/g.51297  ORF Transcript_31100/g.51297 Transcript_31100/m.51297 type:complete len:128 (-) Transcript_31100:23-406(-)
MTNLLRNAMEEEPSLIQMIRDVARLSSTIEDVNSNSNSNSNSGARMFRQRQRTSLDSSNHSFTSNIKAMNDLDKEEVRRPVPKEDKGTPKQNSPKRGSAANKHVGMDVASSDLDSWREFYDDDMPQH